jgi:hypothetical protein
VQVSCIDESCDREDKDARSGGGTPDGVTATTTATVAGDEDVNGGASVRRADLRAQLDDGAHLLVRE